MPFGCIADSKLREFGVMSNTPWQDFCISACAALAADPTHAQLSYRLLDNGGYHGFSRIRGDAEWMSAVSVICEALDQDDEVQIEVLDDRKMVNSIFCLRET
jgi:hypothetical protein